jgi:hypothetical protein
MLALRLIIILFICSACSSSTIPNAFRPIGFSPQEIQQLNDSTNDWYTKSNGKYNLIIDENCPADICSTIQKVDNIPDNEDAIGSCLATADHFGIRTNEACEDAGDDAQTFTILLDSHYNVHYNSLHEFGHALGKVHDPNSNNVMFPDIEEQSRTITDRDLNNPNF